MWNDEFFLHRSGCYWISKARNITAIWNEDNREFVNLRTGESYTSFLRYTEDTVLIMVI